MVIFAFLFCFSVLYTGIPALAVTWELFKNQFVPEFLPKEGLSDPTGALADAIVFEYTNWTDPDGFGYLQTQTSTSLFIGERTWNSIQSTVEVHAKKSGLSLTMYSSGISRTLSENKIVVCCNFCVIQSIWLFRDIYI